MGHNDRMTPDQALALARQAQDQRRAQQDTGLSDWHAPREAGLAGGMAGAAGGVPQMGYEDTMRSTYPQWSKENELASQLGFALDLSDREGLIDPSYKERTIRQALRAANRSAELQGTGGHFRPFPERKDPARSAKFAEYRSDPAWESGFQAVLKNRDQYTMDDLSGSGVSAVGVREDALMRRGDSSALVDMGRAEALEFLERELSKVADRNLAGGMR
jgi:hypothetical protein